MLKAITKTIKTETKEQKGGFVSILLGTFAASLLANLLAGKGVVKAGSGKGIVRSDTGKIGIFNSVSSFNKLSNTKALWERTKI